MKRIAMELGLLALLIAAGLNAQRSAASQAAAAPVGLVQLEGSVNPGSADYLVRAIGRAQSQGLQALIIRLDTPGGLVESTRDIVKAQLASRVPTVVWVGPHGARAGSAGVFLTIASDVAAMAPATNIGAAHPVSVGSGGQEKPDEVMEEKITNDLVAWAQGIARQRGRNPEWVEKAVRQSVSVPADEALRLGVIEIIAPDVGDLMRQLDGRKLKLAAGEVTLATLHAPVVEVAMSPRERFLDALGDPNIAFMLIGLGILGILAELYHPGTLVPGVLGAVSLALGLLATRTLPVRGGAVALMIVGAALIGAEFFVTSWGLLAIGGAICLALGAFLLIDPSDTGYLVDRDFGVSWGSVLPLLLTIAAVLGVVVWKVSASKLAPQRTGGFGLLEEEGVVEEEIGPDRGKVFLHGEAWEARSDEVIARGERVRVVRVEGLLLTVALRKVEPGAGPPADKGV